VGGTSVDQEEMGLLIALLALVTVAVVIDSLVSGWQQCSPQVLEAVASGRDRR
jgi:hypothetical protein